MGGSNATDRFDGATSVLTVRLLLAWQVVVVGGCGVDRSGLSGTYDDTI